MPSKSQSDSQFYSPEKGDCAIEPSYTVSPDPELGSPPSLPPHKNKGTSPSGQKNANDTSKIENNHGWLHSIHCCLHWIFFSGFIGWWIIGAVVLVVLLALCGTIFRTAHIRNVHLLGFFFWLAISWCSLLFSYITSWVLGYFWFHLCQEDRLDFDDYQTFMVDIRHSIMLFLWAIISWALVPLFCVLDHRHCTDHWVSIFHEVLLVTFIFAIVFLVKSFFIERLFIKAAVEYRSWKQRELEKSFYAIVILLPVLNSSQSISKWMEVMRTWSTTPKRARTYTLEEENDLEEVLHSVPPLPECQAQYVADIFQGNGSKYVYRGLLSAIGRNLHIRCNHRDDNHHTRSDGFLSSVGSNLDKGCDHQDDNHHSRSDGFLSSIWHNLHVQYNHQGHTRSDGLYKDDIDEYLRKLQKDPPKCNKDYSLALRQFEDRQFEDGQFKPGIDILWSRLKDKSRTKDKENKFLTFTELHWQIKYLGESLREVVEGQNNLKRVVHSLNIRASLFLCIPVAVIYVAIFTKDFVAYFSSLWTAFFGISFAIQDPVKEFVSACIFVFAQHPYDVGDLVILEDEKDLKLVATEIYLMHTTFEPVGGGREYHIPHTKLSKECIKNFCRPDSHISVVLHLKFDKALQKIEKSMKKIEKRVGKIHEDLKKKLETEVFKIEDSKTGASKEEAFKDYRKRQTLRLYEMPEVTRVPVKEEDFVEVGVRVEFKVKSQTAWIPRTFYPYNEGFRDDVLHYVRRRLEGIPRLTLSSSTGDEKSN